MKNGYKGGARVYEAYQVENKSGKITLSFTSPEKKNIYLNVIVRQKKNALYINTNIHSHTHTYIYTNTHMCTARKRESCAPA